MTTKNKTISEFDYLKSIYTTINLSDYVVIKGNGEKVQIYFEPSPFYILCGELYGDNKFLEWCKDKQLYIKLSELKKVTSCLKKNRGDVEYYDNRVVFKINKKEKNEFSETTELSSLITKSEIVSVEYFDNHATLKIIEEEEIEFLETTELSSLITKVEKISSLLTNEIQLEENSFDDETFMKFIDNEKLIEIPSKRILSIVKNFSKASLRYSEKENEMRYVSVSTENEKIKLTELFAVV